MKGQTYSVIAVLLIVPLLLFMSFYMVSVETMQSGSREKVVSDQEAQLARSIERDFERAIYISGKRALVAATNHVVTEGAPLDNATQAIEELMLQGTLEGNSSELMVGNRIEDWKNTVMGLPAGFSKNVDYRNLSVGRNSGTDMIAGLSLDINVSDSLGIAEITKSMEKSVHISVEYLEDPIFPLNTYGFVKRVVTEYPYNYYAMKILSGTGSGDCSGDVTFDAGHPNSSRILVTSDGTGISGFAGVVAESPGLPAVPCYLVGASDAVDTVNRTVENSGYPGLYLDSATQGAWSLPLLKGLEDGNYYPGGGPTFLSRLEGSLLPESDSMETFVYVPDLTSQGIPVKENQSLVGYKYFSEQDFNGGKVRGFPDWFIVDSGDASRYNLTDLME